MKFLQPSYVFDASAKTVQIASYPSGSLKKEMILLITNVEEGIIIYHFADPAKGGTITPDAGGDIITLDYDTTSMSDTDALQIYLDEDFIPASESNLSTLVSKFPASLGQKTKANSLAVALASDQDALPITDNGGSLTVDGTVAISNSTFPVTDNAGSLTVDAPVGTPVYVRLSDGAAAITTLPVSLASVPSHAVTNAGTFAVQASLNAGTNNIGDVDVLTVPADPFGANADAASATGSISAKLRFIASTGIPITGTVTVGSHAVTNAGTFAVQATIAAGSTNIAKAEDVASAASDVGVPAMAIRKAAPANTSGTDGDYEMLQMSAGRLWTSSTIDAALPAGTNAIGKLAANDGVDIGDVTINNSSIPVTDNAGSLTVDAPVGTPLFARLSDGSAALIGQKAMAASLPVVIASDQGALTVAAHAVTNAGTFAVQDSEKIADNAAFTDGTTKLLPTGYIYDEVAGTALTENDIAAARINANRAQVSTIEDGATRGRYATVSASNALKVDGSAVTQPVSLSGNVNTTSVPTTSGGLTKFHLISAATTNATSVKASAGQLYGWFIYNGASTMRKVVFHDTAGTPTAGASVYFSISIPPGGAANVEFSNGIAFGTGIGITTVTGMADSDSAAVALNDLNINLFYK